MPAGPDQGEHLTRERWELLEHLDRLTDKPMIALAFVWLALLILDFTQGLSALWQRVVSVIWVFFVLDFLLSFSVAPDKRAYLQRNWLTALSLMLPALRVLRVLRAFRALRLLRAVRSINLLRLVTTVNRSFRALGSAVQRRGLPFVVALTLMLTVVGAAGMLTFEETLFRSYWDALWWTAMIMTTMGSETWPQSSEGRFLAWLLAMYAFAVFGYITAAIASYFVGRDQDDRNEANVAQTLRDELALLRREIEGLRQDRFQGPS
ncbi:ion transporter [Deinococcus peraridilitoris]|uniref:Ion transport protein n=1 Tax=Deinococcus peraridilitoris (strain DSM 19664 / LMG 22246 / CIP 109416 / KR-200) TaxID=937777 RepID=L0A2D7_DEIPD|nr:ion transporter [Deinococcus peraridilitoris]AFZ67155.1 Ion transport protein [Deinococcus peraridilitoris DSM 19664]